MSDLRTRIAKAICESTSAGRTFPWETLNERERDAWGSMADAVIRELDLGIPCAADGCRMRKIAIRSAEKLGLVDDDG